ncbi:hypothetical protein P692DRAFT_20742940 [Suillus brevipes Sb2]|nr:hypothetical protein P692DRAFT_20742940 [Suillus brevipes Sb2]
MIDEGEGEGVHAFRRGIVLKCVDGKLCRIFPIISMYSVDYPELCVLSESLKIRDLLNMFQGFENYHY